MPIYPRVLPFGEGAVLVEFGATPNLVDNASAHALADVLASAPPPGLRALVPGYVSLLIEFDPLVDDVLPRVEDAVSRLAMTRPTEAGRLRRVPVVYGGQHGPDLADVAGQLRLSEEQVIAAHVRDTQTVYMLGFAPGHPYVGDLPPELAGLTRLATPRTRVPRGSVAIVGRQTVIYPHSTPGGWRIIGQTPIELWDAGRDPPAYFAPGDRIQFEPMSADDWPRRLGQPRDW
jgi:inhibitor of KinA